MSVIPSFTPTPSEHPLSDTKPIDGRCDPTSIPYAIHHIPKDLGKEALSLYNIFQSFIPREKKIVRERESLEHVYVGQHLHERKELAQT